jgi:RNA polymerase sigma-70 factor, ECF subfamily
MRTISEEATSRIEDGELARRVRVGSMAALGELYARHADGVYASALRILASPADAEDVLHDVFVGLRDALRTYQERGAFAAWLRRLAVRRALMRLRREGRKGVEVAAGSVVPDPTGRIAARRAIESLPDAVRVVFVLKEIEGWSHAEIGAQLGITARASALRLHRAWKLIRIDVGIP